MNLPKLIGGVGAAFFVSVTAYGGTPNEGTSKPDAFRNHLKYERADTDRVRDKMGQAVALERVTDTRLDAALALRARATWDETAPKERLQLSFGDDSWRVGFTRKSGHGLGARIQFQSDSGITSQLQFHPDGKYLKIHVVIPLN